MRLGKTALFHFGSQIIVSLSGFAATFLIAVVLGADGLGRYSIIVAIGFFWLQIPGTAISKSTTKRISEGEDQSEYFGGGVIINAIITFSIVIVILIISSLIDSSQTGASEFIQTIDEFGFEISLLILTATAYKTFRAILEGGKRVAESGALKAVERVVRTLVQVGFLAIGYGVAAITIGHAFSLFIIAIAAFLLIDLRPSMPSFSQLKRIFDFAKYAWLGALRGRVFGWMDTIVLSFFVSASLIGIYEASWGIASLLAIASGSISQTLFPEVSDLSTDDKDNQISHYLNEALTFSGIIVIPGFIGALIIGSRVLRFYRPEFTEGATVLVILIGAYVADVYASQFLNVINAVDRPDVAFRVNIAFITVNLVLNIGLVWLYGWYGAAVATAASAGVRYAAGYYSVNLLLSETSIPYQEIGLQILSGTIMGSVVWVVNPQLPQGRIWTLLVVGIGAVTYFVILHLISGRVRKKTISLLPAV